MLIACLQLRKDIEEDEEKNLGLKEPQTFLSFHQKGRFGEYLPFTSIVGEGPPRCLICS